MNDDKNILWSEKGFAFTAAAVDKMAAWSKEMHRQNCVVVWSIAILEQGEIRVGLGGTTKEQLLIHPQFRTDDRVRDIQFCWIAGEPEFNAVSNKCIHCVEGHLFNLTPLTPEQLKQRSALHP